MPKAPPIGDADQLQKILAKIRDGAKNAQPETSSDPLHTLIESFFMWNASAKQAQQALSDLMNVFVDYLELRVALPHEFIEIIGEDYPVATERIIRLRDVLYEVYLRERGLELKSLLDKPKKEQRAYLDSLPGIPPYVAARVMLVAFEGHGVPVDEKLCTLLAREGALSDEHVRPADAEAFLMKQVKAADAAETHAALQAWSDRHKTPEVHRDEAEVQHFDDVLEAANAAKKKKKSAPKKKPAAKS